MWPYDIMPLLIKMLLWKWFLQKYWLTIIFYNSLSILLIKKQSNCLKSLRIYLKHILMFKRMDGFKKIIKMYSLLDRGSPTTGLPGHYQATSCLKSGHGRDRQVHLCVKLHMRKMRAIAETPFVWVTSVHTSGALCISASTLVQVGGWMCPLLK